MSRPLTCPADWRGMYDLLERQPSGRKRMLTGCGCCRLTWAFVPDRRHRQAVEASERYADGRIGLARLQRRWALAYTHHPVVNGYWMVALAAGPGRPEHDWGCGCRRCRSDRTEDHPRALDALPRPVRDGLEGRYLAVAADVFGRLFHPVALVPDWQSETAVTLATGIYTDRAFDRMPILADALEEAGCDHPDILTHCRGPGPHVRGCWVVDLVLGKG